MTLVSSDGNRSVDIGQATILHSLYSTILVRIKDVSEFAPDALRVLKSGVYTGKDGLMVARQLNLIRDRLAQLSPELAVYDMNNLSARAPWEGHISEVITSCGNMFLTADGKDLLFELVSILVYAYYAHVYIKNE